MKKLLILPLILFSMCSCEEETSLETYPDWTFKYLEVPTDLDWDEMADKTTATLLDRYWHAEEGRSCFNLPANAAAVKWHYWHQPHGMDVLLDAYIRTEDNKYTTYFDPWFVGIKARNGNSYINDYTDDNAWAAITFTRLYEITKDQKYLDAAKDTWHNGIIRYWSEKEGGGIPWWLGSGSVYAKSSCTNGPATIVAANLYKITGEEEYLTDAIRIYAWLRAALFDPSSGAVWDRVVEGVYSGYPLSYNSGTFVGAALRLYDITGEKQYLKDAVKAADYCISSPTITNRTLMLIRGEGSGGNGLFKGIFIRYFTELINHPDLDSEYKSKFHRFITHNAVTAITAGVNEELYFGTSWGTPGSAEETEQTTQTSGCTLIEAMCLLKPLK